MIQNAKLDEWIEKVKALTTPDRVVVCDGTPEEYARLCDQLVDKGTFVRLNPEKRPNSFAAFSDPSDVARVEDRTFICSKSPEDAGPTNNWKDPDEMMAILGEKFRGCMQGRTLYVVPFCMCEPDSKLAMFGVEFTDSEYVVVNMHLMTRMGPNITARFNEGIDFCPAVHSVGAPLEPGQEDVSWPCNDEKYICHFPEIREIWSYGSGYGGNALLGKKCLALRIASVVAKENGWYAEHMLILAITPAKRRKFYIAAAFPSGCGKTNMAMLKPNLVGWTSGVVGDDIAWMWPDEEGRIRALNPEHGFFGIAPMTSYKTNPVMMKGLRENAIFTNVALTEDGDVWWEGQTDEPPAGLMSWKKEEWTLESGEPASHPNARFTVNIRSCPMLDQNAYKPEGVVLDAILFGGRRGDIPVVREAQSWNQGVLFGASLSSETTAASVGQTGKLRHDPFAMLPFCGYHMGDYFQHWIELGKQEGVRLPKIFYVNWFKKDEDGSLLWPGYGDNIRIVDWILKRVQNEARPVERAFGNVPQKSDLNLENMPKVDVDKLFDMPDKDVLVEVEGLRDYFAQFGDRCPEELFEELDKIQAIAQSEES
ncbi:MAG: Phosphoenolpyruvate carboxykinase [GTP] [Chlamydiia bacterium]|nr:Phosphoenolpyruvate carboxykinase [GTP] [Chlamydiia bacterium]